MTTMQQHMEASELAEKVMQLLIWLGRGTPLNAMALGHAYVLLCREGGLDIEKAVGAIRTHWALFDTLSPPVRE